MSSEYAFYSWLVRIGNVVKVTGHRAPLPIGGTIRPRHTHVRSMNRGGNRWLDHGAAERPV